jgi:hypothetical protein
VPERAPGEAPHRELCPLCGAEILAVSSPGSEPRGQLDTLRLDALSLATLVRLGESTHTGSGRDENAAPPRAPMASIPFELSRARSVPLGAPRAPQPSIPFELNRESAEAKPRPSQASIPFEPGREDWEKTFVARVKKRRYGLILVVVVALLVAGLVASGLVNPMRVLK